MCQIKRSGGWLRYRLCEETAAVVQYQLDQWGLAMAAVAVQLDQVPWWELTSDLQGTAVEYATRARVCGMIGHTLRGWHRFAKTKKGWKRGRTTPHPGGCGHPQSLDDDRSAGGG